MPITPLNTTDTFRTWYLRTNEIIAALTSGILTDGVSADGVFTIGSNAANRLIVTNALNVSPSNVTVNAIATLNANTTFTANVAVSSAAALVTLAPTSLVIQASNNTLIDSTTTVNGTATFTKAVTVNGTLTVANTAAISGGVTVGGDLTANAGALITRQLLFKATGAIAANTVSAATIHNFAPTGLADATILAITPTGETALTGLLAPTNVTPGGRMLFIQNLSDTYNITFKSANTGSTATNQFKTSNDEDVILKPGGLLAAVWSSQTGANHWRLISTGSTANLLVNATLSGTTNVAGAVGINGVASFTANVAVATNALFVNATNKRVGANTASPSEALEVVGTMKSTAVSTGAITGTGVATLGGLNVASGALFSNATHVGVRTATPTVELDVVGVVKSTSLTTGAITGSGLLTTTANVSLAASSLLLDSASKQATFGGILYANSTANSYVRRFTATDISTTTLAVSGAVTFGGTITAPTVAATTLNVGGGSTFTGTANFGLANFTTANAAAASVSGALTVGGAAYIQGAGTTLGTLASATQLTVQGTSATENWDVALFKTNTPWGGIMVQGGTANTGLNVLKVKNTSNYQYNIGLGAPNILFDPITPGNGMKNSWFVYDASGNTSIDSRAVPAGMRLILYPSGLVEIARGLRANTVQGTSGLVVPVGVNKWMVV
jgi:hypothetical protein